MTLARAKSIFASRIAWLNAAATVVAVVTSFQSQPWVQEYPRVAAACATVLAVANVVLRILTSQPIRVI